MYEAWGTAGAWLLRITVGGSLLLLVTWALMRWTRQPARQQRLGEWGLMAALLLAVLGLAPAWWVVTVPWPVEPPLASDPLAAMPSPFAPLEESEPFVEDEPRPPISEMGESEPASGAVDSSGPAVPDTGTDPQPIPTSGPLATPTSAAESDSSFRASAVLTADGIIRAVAIAYLVGGVVLLVRWLLRYLALLWLLRRTEPAPQRVLNLLYGLTGARPPRLVISRRLPMPLSCGLLRPTVVLPAELCRSADAAMLRWILIHELTHLRRRDAWTALLFAVGQSFYYFVPWFWSLRRQVRLCQEYVADAAAVAPKSRPADYAQFLLKLTQLPKAPAGAAGVAVQPSELCQRVTMLLQGHTAVEPCCPRLCSLLMAVGLLSLAVVVSGLGLRADAASADDAERLAAVVEPLADEPKPDAPAKEEPKPNTPVKQPERVPKLPPMPDFEDFLNKLPPNLPAEQVEQLRKQLGQQQEAWKRLQENWQKTQDDARRALELRQWQPGPFGFGAAEEARLGVRLNRPSDILAAQLGLPKGKGLVLEQVRPDSAAARAGLKSNDILVQLDGKPVPSEPREFARLLEAIPPNSPVDVVVKRGGKDETIKGLSLPETPRPSFPVRYPGRQDDPRLGARFDRPSDILSDQLGLPRGQGLVVEQVTPTAAAAKAGFRPNDILLELNGKPVSSDYREFLKALDEVKPGTPVEAVVLRKGQKETLKGLTLPEARQNPRRSLPRNQPGAALVPAFKAVGEAMGTSISRNGDQFTARHRDGATTISVTGRIVNRKSQVSEIRIDADGVIEVYANLGEVPDEYRDRVKMLAVLGGGGALAIRGLSLIGN